MISWDKNLETGVSDIDEQHKKLFELSNQVLNACREGKGKLIVKDSLNFLDSYVKKHFQEEEQIQKKYKYPEYEEHKKMHKYFIDELEKLEKKFESEGAILSVTVALNKLIGTWLREHINKVDKKLAIFIKNS